MRNEFNSKKASDEYTSFVTSMLIATLGVTDPHTAERLINGQRFTVETDLGTLEGKFLPGTQYYPERRNSRLYSVGWVHFRFHDADRAKASHLYAGHDGRLNGYSGKWNWMLSSERYEWEIPVMADCIRRLNPTGLAILN